MISSRLTRRGFCHAVILAVVPAVKNNLSVCRLPEPRFKIGDRVRTERTCSDHISPNYEGLDWECGLVVGYVWEYDEWLQEDLRRGWTYFIQFYESNYGKFGDRLPIDFAHESELIQNNLVK